MNETKKPIIATPIRPPAMPPTTFPTLTPEVAEGVEVALEVDKGSTEVIEGSETVPKELVATKAGAVSITVLRA